MSTPTSGNAFRRRVLAIVRAIPRGHVLAYGEVATAAGSPRAARAVGNTLRSLGRAEGDVPWHRVVNARLRITFKGDTERATLQRRRLEAEQVRFGESGTIDASHRWDLAEAPSFVDEPLAPWEPPEDWTDDDARG